MSAPSAGNCDEIANICTKDNTKDTPIDHCALPALRPYSARTLGKLAEEYPDLLAIPAPHTHKDRVRSSHIYTLNEDAQGEGHLSTDNIVGFLGLPARNEGGAVNLRIHSRFDTGEQQYFFQYMLQRVFCPTLIDLPPPPSDESIFSFLLAFLFPAYLQRAINQGLYKEYCRKEYNDANIKGPIDIARHIKQNIPFVGRVAYRTREHSYNNRITHLVRHTIEHLRARGWLFDIGVDAKAARQRIIDATDDYHTQRKQRTIAHNRNAPVRHPFFTEYEPLRRLCLRILDHQGLSLERSQNTKRVTGVLFDCAWLWEEYLATLLPMHFKHPQNITGKGGVPVYIGEKSSRCFPDFYSKNASWDTSIVLDAKYKRYGDWQNKAGNSDLYQLISYVHILKAQCGALIFPRTAEMGKKETDKTEKTAEPLGTLNGHGGTLHKIALAIPDYKSQDGGYHAFSERMQCAEQKFLKDINQIQPPSHR